MLESRIAANQASFSSSVSADNTFSPPEDVMILKECVSEIKEAYTSGDMRIFPLRVAFINGNAIQIYQPTGFVVL